MRKPEVMVAKGGGGGGGGGGSSSSNSWGSGLCANSCRLLQKWTSSTTSSTKKKKSSHVKGGNVHTSTTKFKFGEDEDDLIIKLHALLGNRWSLIAGRLPGRTDNEVKNYWNSHLRKKLQNKGINPDNRRSLSQTVVPTNFMTSVKAAPTSCINDQVSDAVSGFSADYGTATTTSPMVMPTDLNLELTLTINPSPSSVLISSCRFTETDQQHVDQFKLGNMEHHDHQFMKNETLLLFR